jgi:hypothetical protein
VKRASALASLTFAAFAALSLCPTLASAYCRTAACAGGLTGSRCVPAAAEDCGTPLAWPSPCVTYSVQEDASAQVALGDAEAIFEKAFGAWMNADCGGGTHPRIRVRYAGPVPCGLHEYNQDAGNANIFVFRDELWPHPSKSTLALTTVTYNLDNGQIYDADMELNSASVTFSVSDTSVTYDLQSVATHEVGHFLGISHSSLSEATMRPDYLPGSLGLRDLDADDAAAICATYPPGAAIPADCDDTPRHGASGLCAADQPKATETSDGCSITPGPAGPPGRAVPWLAIAGSAASLVALRRSRRARRAAC